MSRVLVVDDEAGIRETLAEFLKDEGHVVDTADSVEAASQALAREAFDVVVSDILMPRISGLDLLRQLHASAPRVKVILITGEPSLLTATEALRLGAHEYLTKPVTQTVIARVVGGAARIKALEDENYLHQQHLERLVELRTTQIRAYTERLREVAEQTKRFAQCQDIVELAPQILALFAQNIAAQGGSFYRYSQNGLELLFSLESDHQPQWIPLPPPPNSVLSRVIERKEGFFIGDIAEDPSLSASGWTGYQGGSLLALPCLDSYGAIQGIVTLHNKIEPPFTEEDLEIGRIIAGHTVEAIRAIELNRRLRESEQRYKEISEKSLTGIFVAQNRRFVYVNPNLAALLGHDPQNTAALLHQPIDTYVHPEDREWLGAQAEQMTNGTMPSFHGEFRLLHPDGSSRWVEALFSRIEHLGENAVMGHVIDISEKRRAAEEKQRLQQQYFQAQKMEAIGRLASGVAHDFNNILTGILGFADVVIERMAPDHVFYDDLVEISSAAERAAALTRQLLAFSRKHIIAPKVIDLNQIVSHSQRMLTRLIGEDVLLVFNPGHTLWSVKADPSQIDQILVNLATNARDAMPHGGQLTLQTANLTIKDPAIGPPGDYVVLAVTDTGCGMDEATRARIFEPFYTTKERGTGLGLATVHDIVEHYGGFIGVESTPTAGTTLSIHFLRQTGETPGAAAEDAARRAVGGHETLLVAEDDMGVRRLLQETLNHLGYRVLLAREADEAQILSDQYQEPIHLLISDVVMPGVSGHDLYQWLVYISGQARRRQTAEDPFGHALSPPRQGAATSRRSHRSRHA
ncbi:MAG: response regulator [Vicinamibacteria bacterium]|nr:response regulator [Vicinamibacteria bacterium]